MLINIEFESLINSKDLEVLLITDLPDPELDPQHSFLLTCMNRAKTRYLNSEFRVYSSQFYVVESSEE